MKDDDGGIRCELCGAVMSQAAIRSSSRFCSADCWFRTWDREDAWKLVLSATVGATGLALVLGAFVWAMRVLLVAR